MLPLFQQLLWRRLLICPLTAHSIQGFPMFLSLFAHSRWLAAALIFHFSCPREWVSTREGEEENAKVKKKRIVFGAPLSASYVFPPVHRQASLRASLLGSTVKQPYPRSLVCYGTKGKGKKKSKRIRPWRKQEEGISQLILGLKKREGKERERFLGYPARGLGMRSCTKRKRTSAVQCSAMTGKGKTTMSIHAKHVPLPIVPLCKKRTWA